jgi:membrane protease YdiL (CAAX protease family)
MRKQKDIIWYLAISFSFAWVLFLLPLLYGAPGTTTWQTISLITWSTAMWAPGLSAIIVTLQVDKKSISSLNLQRLGDRKSYLWAWMLPIFLTLAAGVLTWLTGVGKLDLEFTQIRQTMAQANGPQIPPFIIIGLQIAGAITINPLFNTLFAMGEELGWRGYLLPKLEPHGQARAIVLSGVIWGVSHMPVILQGHNYPEHPLLGVFLMIVFCVLFGAFLSWLYLRTRSPWAPALGHGTLNAVGGLPLLFMPGVDLAFGGPLSSVLGWIPIIVFLVWLLWRGKLPVNDRVLELWPSIPTIRRPSSEL